MSENEIDKLFEDLQTLIYNHYQEKSTNTDDIEKELLFLQKKILKLKNSYPDKYVSFMHKCYSISYGFYLSESNNEEAASALKNLNKFQRELDEINQETTKINKIPLNDELDSDLDAVLDSVKGYLENDKYNNLKNYFDVLKNGANDFNDYQKLLKNKKDCEKIMRGFVTEQAYELLSDTENNSEDTKLEILSKIYFNNMKMNFMEKIMISKRSIQTKKLFGEEINHDNMIRRKYRLLELVFHPDKNKEESDEIKFKCREMHDLIDELKNELLKANKIFEYLDEDFSKENLKLAIDYNNAILQNCSNFKILNKNDLTHLTNKDLENRRNDHALKSYNGYKTLCKKADQNSIQSDALIKKRVVYRKNISRSLLYLDITLEAQIYCISAIRIIVDNFNEPFTFQDLNDTKMLLDEIKNNHHKKIINNNNLKKTTSNETNYQGILAISNISSKTDINNYKGHLNKEMEGIIQELYLTPNDALVNFNNLRLTEDSKIGNKTATLAVVVVGLVSLPLAPIVILGFIGAQIFKSKKQPKILALEMRTRQTLDRMLKSALEKFHQKKFNEFFHELQKDNLIWKSQFNDNNAINIVDSLVSHGLSPDSIAYILNLIGEALISNTVKFPDKESTDLRTKAIEFFQAVSCDQLKTEAINIDNKVFEYLTNNVHKFKKFKAYFKLLFGFSKSYDENQMAKEYMNASQEMLIETRLREMSCVAKINIILIRLIENVTDVAIKKYYELKEEIENTSFEITLAEYKLQAIEDLLNVIAGYKREVADNNKLAITEKENNDKYLTFIETRLRYESNITADSKPIYEKAAYYETEAKENLRKGFYEKSLESWQLCLKHYERALIVNKSDSFSIIKIAYCNIKLFNYKRAIDLLVNKEDLIIDKFRTEYYLYLAKAFRKMKNDFASKLSIQKAGLYKIDIKNEDIIYDLNNEKTLIDNLQKRNEDKKFEIHRNLKFNFNTKSSNIKSTYKILSIDGGGTRGIIPSYWLMELERIVRKPVCQMFDLLAGVSTGALISSCLSLPNQESNLLPKYKAFDVYNLYLNESKDLFKTKNNIGYFFGTDTKYNNDGLIFKLNQYIGNLKLDKCLTDIVIPSIRVDNYTTTPYCFNRFDAKNNPLKNFKLFDAVMATTAAPTYFPAHKIKDLGIFVDGGVQCNNPTEIALNEALRYGYKHEDVFILSLGTGTYLDSSLEKVYSEDLNKGWLYWVKDIHGVAVGAQSANVNESIINRFSNTGFDRYYRWQIWFDKIYKLDTCDKNDLINLSYCAEEFFEEMQHTNEESFHKLIHKLSD